MYRLYTGNVSTVYWKCIDCILEMYRLYTGNASNLYWKCIESILEMYRLYTGNVSTVYWKCIDRILEMHRLYTGNVSTVYLRWKKDLYFEGSSIYGHKKFGSRFGYIIIIIIIIIIIVISSPQPPPLRWHSRLRHCATNKKVAGSIPDGVTGILHWHNSSGRTMDLGSTQPLTEMSKVKVSHNRPRWPRGSE
jgi:hypothetical protein